MYARWRAPLPGSHDVPDQGKNCVGAGKAKKVTLLCARPSQETGTGHVRSNHPVPHFPHFPQNHRETSCSLSLPVVSYLHPNVTLFLVKAAPSEITQLPVHAKRYLSLILEDGLMLFQKVLPCCAFGFHYLIY